jgi:hypothetical protein
LICGKNPTSLVVASASDDFLNGAGKRNKIIVRELAARRQIGEHHAAGGKSPLPTMLNGKQKKTGSAAAKIW